MMVCDFSNLKGKTFVDVVVSDDNEEVLFVVSDNEKYKLFHSQNCCESVTIESIVGDVKDLIGAEILIADEATSGNANEVYDADEMWTFYKLATVKGYVDIRWYGSSNGYYSIEVSFARV